MKNYIKYLHSDAGKPEVGGGAGRACAPFQSFGISVNPIRTKGSRLCPPYYYWPPHIFGRCGISANHYYKYNNHIVISFDLIRFQETMSELSSSTESTRKEKNRRVTYWRN